MNIDDINALRLFEFNFNRYMMYLLATFFYISTAIIFYKERKYPIIMYLYLIFDFKTLLFLNVALTFLCY